jgi:hypothetical protein
MHWLALIRVSGTTIEKADGSFDCVRGVTTELHRYGSERNIVCSSASDSVWNIG